MARLNALTLAEVDRRIRELEREYGIATAQFFKDVHAHASVSEDDILMWEMYVDFRHELREIDKRMQQRYLGHIERGDKSSNPSDLVELAA